MERSFIDLCLDVQEDVFREMDQLTLWLLRLTCKTYLGYLSDRITIIFHDTMDLAIKNRSDTIFRVLCNSKKYDEETVATAAREGRLDLVKYLRGLGCSWDRRTVFSAIIGDRPDVLEYAISNECIAFPSSALKVYGLAGRCGHLDIIRWLVDPQNTLAPKDLAKSTIISINAAGRCHPHVLDFLKTAGYKLSPLIRAKAAECGHLPVLAWCHTQGQRFTVRDFAFAAKGGNLEVMKWLLSIAGCPFDGTVCATAALGGQFDTLRWLREQGCPWDKRVYSQARKIKDKARRECIILWAQEHGCPED